MGYNTDYDGKMQANKKIKSEDAELLRGLFSTRRMKREGLHESYGIDGEFFFPSMPFGIDPMLGVVESNRPPSTQPSLWCDLKLLDDDKTIVWSGVEKTYKFKEWLEYIIKILGDKYIFDGEFEYQGEDDMDIGWIEIEDNQVMLF